MNKIQRVTIKQVKRKTKYDSKRIASLEDASDILKDYLKDADREYFVVMTLDTKNYISLIETVAIGIINACLVAPREVYKAAILSNATSIIVAHNHPSGDTHPSKEDLILTKRIKESGDILGIKLLDSIVIGNDVRSIMDEI